MPEPSSNRNTEAAENGWRKMWPIGAWRRWSTDTPKGLKRYDVLQYLASVVPVISAGALWYSAVVRDAVRAEPIQFGVALLASLFVLAGILGKRKRDSIERQARKDYKAGIEEAYNQWRESAVTLQGGMAMTYRFVEAYTNGETRETGEAPIHQYLHVIALLVREIFHDQDPHITVSIAVPVSGKNELKTAKFQSESPGRHPGRTIPLSDRAKGAAKAYLSKHPQYVANTQERSLRNTFRDRTYRSFMSWPVPSGRGDTIVAVVSIDSPVANGFDAENQLTRREQVYWMAQPALAGIAICLLDAKTFERYRHATTT